MTATHNGRRRLPCTSDLARTEVLRKMFSSRHKKRQRHHLAGQSRTSRSISARHQTCRNYLQASAYYMHEQGTCSIRWDTPTMQIYPFIEQLADDTRRPSTQHKDQKQSRPASCIVLHDCFETQQLVFQLDRSRTLYAAAAR